MKSINSHPIAGLCSGLILSLVLAASAHAGPGFQYWQSQGKQAAQPAPQAIVSVAMICPDCHLVAVTVLKSCLPNGRGPLAAVQIGTKRECSACGSTIASALKPSQPNGRGALTAVQVATEHDCVPPCCVAPTQS